MRTLLPTATATPSRTSRPAPEAPAAPEVLCQEAPDWLAHRFAVSGPAAALAGFRRAAAGLGSIPWQVPMLELQEGWFNLLVALPPSRRGISVAGARVLSGQLGAAVAAREAADTELPDQDEESGIHCPLDLHALVPVPGEVLLLGPEDVRARAWLWEHWGTTWPLRGASEVEPVAAERRRARRAEALVCYAFHSADWSPWRALVQVRARWPELRFHLRPDYDRAADPLETEAEVAKSARLRREARDEVRSEARRRRRRAA